MVGFLNRLIAALLFILLAWINGFAEDKYLGGATNNFQFCLFDISSSQNGIPSRTYNTDYVLKTKCTGDVTTTINGTGDTITDNGGGCYEITFNDSVTNNAEDECSHWAEGAGSYAGLIAKTPAKFKAVAGAASILTAATVMPDTAGTVTLLARIPSVLSLTGGNVHAHVKASDATVGMNYADISASTSGSSFTIVSAIDFQGNAITMTTDFLKNRLVKAYTNGGAPCNVNGQGGWVNTVTSGGLVTLDISTTGSGFTAIPNTTNCGVMWAP